MSLLRSLRPLALFVLLLALAAPLSISSVTAQESAPLNCEPVVASPQVPPALASTPQPVAPFEGETTEVSIALVPISIYAPLMIAQEKGYFAEQGLEVTLETAAGGSELVALTASGEFDAVATGAGPGFWNAVAQGLPVEVVAPGHAEGNPVATPLMISKAACESGEITGVADLAGKKVAVNARGATEYWLGQALATGGLTIEDIELQTLAFPDAVVALDAGAIDAAMVGEPIATQAEREGLAVRLLTDFPVQDVQPTVILANSDFADDNPEAMQGIVTAYLKACRDLSGPGFFDPANLTIIEQYTGVPADLVSAAVQPVYFPNGEIDVAGFNKLQTFFRERGQLEYDDDLDPASFVDTQYVDAAVEELGPFAEQ